MVFNRQSLKSGLWSILSDLKASKSRLRFTAVLIFLLACGVVILYLCVSSLFGPVGGSPLIEETIQIRPGMSATEIGGLLEEKGFIRNSLLFRLASSLKGTNRSLKAGEYVVSTDMNTFKILDRIASGDSALYRFTIPEGFTLDQIATLWEEKEFGTKAAFMEASGDPTVRKTHNIHADDLEGYLYPDTYMFPRGISEKNAINEMVRQFNNKVSHLMAAKSKGVDLSTHEVISLASIIEKEAKIEEEKPLISAVFHNRLKRGHRLESCATVLYSLGYPRRKLTDKDLKDTDSPYNTYIHPGLPPGPICNPGLVSIVAALNPSEDKYLYFVSRNDGTHYFTESYSKFLDAKRKYKDG